MALKMNRRQAIATLSAALAANSVGFAPRARAQEKTEFRLAWSIYAGWMPWGELQSSGLMQKWADEYGLSVEIVQINDYIESINQYTIGAFDGCAMTNMDALSIPSGGGVDTTALVIGDFSNGNDGIVLKGSDQLADIAGRDVNLVELSVSHYLLVRALETVGLSERDLSVINTSDADLVSLFTTPGVNAVVTWNPLLSEITAMPDAFKVFDSSQTPGEIIDTMMVNTDVLAANPNFGKAVAGAWYEMMGVMSADDDAAITARTNMAEASGTDLAGYDAQLEATAMFYDAADAVAFAEAPELKTTMDFVRNFLFDKGILGEGAETADFVGIEYADGSVAGDAGNVKLRFDPSYMRMAAEGAL